jgi:curved DNA-binding protein CbpA
MAARNMGQPKPDLYAVLGTRRDAGQREIGHAYRELVRQYHPDSRAAPNASSDAKLLQIIAAYRVLRDPRRRAAYDEETASPDPPDRVQARRYPAPSAGVDPAVRVRPVRAAPATDVPPIRVGPVYWRPSSRRG